MDRCYKKQLNYGGYEYYGGRGIRVCDEWHLFINFLYDMGKRPDGTTLDRKENEGNYEPNNCRWATSAVQAQNRRTTILTFNDVQEILGRLEHHESKQSIADRFGVSKATVKDIKQGRSWPQMERPWKNGGRIPVAVQKYRVLRDSKL